MESPLVLSPTSMTHSPATAYIGEIQDGTSELNLFDTHSESVLSGMREELIISEILLDDRKEDHFHQRNAYSQEKQLQSNQMVQEDGSVEDWQSMTDVLVSFSHLIGNPIVEHCDQSTGWVGRAVEHVVRTTQKILGTLTLPELIPWTDHATQTPSIYPLPIHTSHIIIDSLEAKNRGSTAVSSSSSPNVLSKRVSFCGVTPKILVHPNGFVVVVESTDAESQTWSVHMSSVGVDTEDAPASLRNNKSVAKRIPSFSKPNVKIPTPSWSDTSLPPLAVPLAKVEENVCIMERNIDSVKRTPSPLVAHRRSSRQQERWSTSRGEIAQLGGSRGGFDGAQEMLFETEERSMQTEVQFGADEQLLYSFLQIHQPQEVLAAIEEISRKFGVQQGHGQLPPQQQQPVLPDPNITGAVDSLVPGGRAHVSPASPTTLIPLAEHQTKILHSVLLRCRSPIVRSPDGFPPLSPITRIGDVEVAGTTTLVSSVSITNESLQQMQNSDLANTSTMLLRLGVDDGTPLQRTGFVLPPVGRYVLDGGQSVEVTPAIRSTVSSSSEASKATATRPMEERSKECANADLVRQAAQRVRDGKVPRSILLPHSMLDSVLGVELQCTTSPKVAPRPPTDTVPIDVALYNRNQSTQTDVDDEHYRRDVVVRGWGPQQDAQPKRFRFQREREVQTLPEVVVPLSKVGDSAIALHSTLNTFFAKIRSTLFPSELPHLQFSGVTSPTPAKVCEALDKDRSIATMLLDLMIRFSRTLHNLTVTIRSNATSLGHLYTSPERDHQAESDAVEFVNNPPTIRLLSRSGVTSPTPYPIRHPSPPVRQSSSPPTISSSNPLGDAMRTSYSNSIGGSTKLLMASIQQRCSPPDKLEPLTVIGLQKNGLRKESPTSCKQVPQHPFLSPDGKRGKYLPAVYSTSSTDYDFSSTSLQQQQPIPIPREQQELTGLFIRPRIIDETTTAGEGIVVSSVEMKQVPRIPSVGSRGSVTFKE